MAFPTSPINGQSATVNGIAYTYNSTKTAWVRVSSSSGVIGANLVVAGILTDNYYYANGSGLIGTNKSIYTGTITATTSATLIDTLPIAGNTSVTWTLTSKDNTNSRYKTSMLGSLNDGTNVYYNEYGIILSDANNPVSTFTSNISSGNINLYAVGDSSNVSVTFQRVSLGSSTNTGYLTSGAQGPSGTLSASQGTKANNASGTTGQISFDSDYIYVCTATNTWKRANLTAY